MRTRIALVFAILLLGLGQPGLPAVAQSDRTLYVALTGDDAADCLSEQRACRTIGAAVAKANAGETVRVGAGLYGERLTLARSIAIEGAGANLTTISGGGSGTVVTVLSAQVTVTLSGLAIVDGQAVGGGGGVVNYGTLTLQGVLVARNKVVPGEGFQGLGGGVLNFGTLSIVDSAVVDNRGFTGAGIYSRGTFSAVNLTVAANKAEVAGGGLAFGPGAAALRFSTVSGNSASADAGGIAAEAGAAPVLADSILAGNSDGGDNSPECLGTVTSNGFNVIGSLVGCNFNGLGGDIFDADPRLAPLADNGGATPTLALAPDSPALDAAFAGRCPSTDQRGVARPQGDGCDSGAFERATTVQPPPGRTLYVAPTGDDGASCLSPAAPCRTLAATVNKAAAGDTIRLAAGIYSETISLTKRLSITGAGADSTVIDGGEAGTVVTVLSPQTELTLRDLTVRNGRAVGAGGGIASFGRLVLERVSVQENTVLPGEGFQGFGGGIASFGTAIISDTAVISNTGATGGGIYSQGSLTATNLTLASNVVTTAGAALAAAGETALRFATVAGNRSAGAAGGIQAAQGATVSLEGSILADNGGSTASPECAGAVVSLGGTVIGPSANCTIVAGPGDQIGVDPLLGPLGANGGPTLTRALLPGSPAIDKLFPSSGCPCSIWNDTAVPLTPFAADPNPVELGVKFRASAPGSITGVRFYKDPRNSGPHIANLWSRDGRLLARAPFANESESGWQEVKFANPVPVEAGATYIASYFTSSQGYAYDPGFFAPGSVVRGPLTALGAGVDGPNGVYAYSPSSVFPTESWLAANYWVDVLFVEAAELTCPAADQRGTPRPQGLACDSGAFEVATTSPPNTLFVTEAGSDSNDCLSEDTACASVGAAIGKAPEGATVRIAGGVYVELLNLTRDVTLAGEGVGETIFDGAGAGTVLTVHEGVSAVLRGVTVRGGGGVQGRGIANLGALTIEDSRVEQNSRDAPDAAEGLRSTLTPVRILAMADGTLDTASLPQALLEDGLGSGVANFGSLSMTRTQVLSNTGLIGAGVSNSGDLRMVDSVIAGNSGLIGGGVANFGAARLVRVRLEQNRAQIGGGAANFGDLLLASVSVQGNQAPLGAGVANFGVLEAVNCTLAANAAQVNGGALANIGGARAILRHVTVVGNSATGEGSKEVAGGLANSAGGTISLVNSLLAANTGLAGSSADCVGTLESGGHNLIETGRGCRSLGAPGDLLDVSAGFSVTSGGVPALGALVPRAGSPALDAGDPAACEAHDQRGVERPRGGGCDIGAFEALAGRNAVYLPLLAH